jgi:hypothetical protein
MKGSHGRDDDEMMFQIFILRGVTEKGKMVMMKMMIKGK